MIEAQKLAPLFDGWEETMIWSCLSGCMGSAAVDDEQRPTSARITVGDMCFFAGRPDIRLAQEATAPILVPREESWHPVIEAAWGSLMEKGLRYAIKKEPDVFDRERLAGYASSLGAAYEIRLIDGALYHMAMGETWSKDLCAQFTDVDDYARRGLGAVVLHRGRLVAGASSYTVYPGGIEIEIDTRQDYRKQGLATACGARLILECLERGIYPSWDAHDLRSVALAQKLGYHLDKPYPVYRMI